MKKRMLCFLLPFLLLWAGSSCGENAGGWIVSREDLNGRRMGIVTGTSFEAPTLQFFPASEYFYYFSARMPGLVSGKYDMCASSMAITEERRESISFSEPFYHGGIVLAVRKADAAAQASESAALSAQGTVSALDALNGKRIGVPTGTNCGPEAEARLTDVEIKYYNNHADMLTALRSGKVDAIVTDAATLRFLQIENDDLEELEEKFSQVLLAPAFPKNEKGEALCEQYSAFVRNLWSDGTMDALQEAWLGKDESLKTVLDYEALPGENGTLTMALDATLAPFAYVKDGRIVGYDVDVAARFCEASGYRLKIVNSSFDGVLASVQSGKCDFAACGVTVTEERAENVLFGEATFYSGNVAAVLKQNTGAYSVGSASLQDLNGKRIGVATGTTFDAIVLKALPDAKPVYINSSADLIAALESGKIDGFAVDEPAAKQFCAVNPRLTVVDEYLDTFDFGVVLPKNAKGDALLEELNAWLVPMKESGALEQVIDQWAYGSEEGKTLPDYAAFPAPKGTLTLATEGDYVPMTYYRGSEIVGAEIDLIAQFCEANGYGLKVQVMNFDGILPAVQSGKADFAAAGISITDERRESVNFSVPYYSGGTVMVVLKNDITAAVRQPSENAGKYTSFDDLTTARIGIQTGTTHDAIVQERFPDAKITYFNSYTDMVAALRTDKIDAFPGGQASLRKMAAENSDIVLMDEYLVYLEVGFVMPKTEAGEKLKAEMDEWLTSLRATGEMERIIQKWESDTENKETVPDYKAFPAPNGTLTLATEASYAPFMYYRGDEIAGLELDFTARFCEAYGYGLNVVNMSFDAILPAISAGKADFAAAGIAITEERKESALFSVPYYSDGIVMAVLRAEETAAPAEEETTFWGGIVSSFNKTFLREDRWHLFADGVLTTLLITVLSILSGTALGFGIFMLCRNGNIVANGVTRFSMWLVQGMPMVVLLMILYYVIFGSVAISGIFVAVIGFTLTFGASVFGLLKMGVGAIDRGQYEAAYALGYANRRTFFRIILPQAIPHILPAYKGEIVGLIKATAIVGYIAVQDLTKMGDIVRSRTYEAFFPLIAVTVIYFVLEGLLGFLVSRIQIRMNPKKRKPESILKGVNLHD